MADLASTPLVKMTDIEIATDTPITEDLLTKIGININALIDRASLNNSETFTAGGTYTPGTNTYFVVVVGAGGGGGGGGSNSTLISGGSGGCGAHPIAQVYATTPGVGVSVTIGAGGAGGAIDVDGSDGTASTFGTIFFPGAPGGLYFPDSNGFTSRYLMGDATASGGGRGAGFGAGYIQASNGRNSVYASGGSRSGSGSSVGGGGGAGWGAGGGSGAAASANTSGGGGGGTAGGAGAAGGSGKIIVYW